MTATWSDLKSINKTWGIQQGRARGLTFRGFLQRTSIDSETISTVRNCKLVYPNDAIVPPDPQNLFSVVARKKGKLSIYCQHPWTADWDPANTWQLDGDRISDCLENAPPNPLDCGALLAMYKGHTCCNFCFVDV